jgi:2-methylcitrate dehydratase PrpD
LADRLRQDQARRTQAAAQAAAHRRAVVAVALALLGMVGGSVALVREVGIQAVEVRRG